MHGFSRLVEAASVEDRLADIESRLRAVEASRSPRLTSPEAPSLDAARRVTALEKTVEQDRRRLYDATAGRLRDFQRRIGAEWIALRRLHEDAVAAVHRRADALAIHDRRRSMAVVVLSAALALVTCDAIYLHWRLRAIGPDTARAAAPDRDVSIDERLAAAERSARESHAVAAAASAQAAQMLDVVSAVDTRRLPLLGQGRAAGASGQVLWSRARGLLLSASGIPPLDAGSVYQVWVATTRGSLSLGYAAPDARGRISAAFDLPPGLSGTVTGFSVTREARGGAAAPGAAAILVSP